MSAFVDKTSKAAGMLPLLKANSKQTPFYFLKKSEEDRIHLVHAAILSSLSAHMKDVVISVSLDKDGKELYRDWLDVSYLKQNNHH